MSWVRSGPAAPGNRWHLITSRDAKVTIVACTTTPIATVGSEARSLVGTPARCQICSGLKKARDADPARRIRWSKQMAARRVAEHVTPHNTGRDE